MASSQNGWSVIGSNDVASYTVPNTDVKLPIRKGDVATVLIYVATRFNNEVQKLHKGWCWGYAIRKIIAAVSISNHASATAIDLNAPLHPLGIVGTFTKSQRYAINAILKDCYAFGKPVVRWGGNYTNRKDEMHFEIIGTPSQVNELARKIKGIVVTKKTTPTIPSKPPTPQRIKMFLAAENKPIKARVYLFNYTDYTKKYVPTPAIMKEFQDMGIPYKGKKSDEFLNFFKTVS